MFKTLTSFFRFYFYTFTGNKGKQEEIATEIDERMTVVATPLVFMIIHGLISFFFPVITLWMFAWIPVAIGSAIHVFSINERIEEEEEEKARIEREARSERIRKEFEELQAENKRREERRRQQEQMEEILRRERQRKERAEKQKLYDEYVKEYERLMEEMRREKEREEFQKRRRAYEEWNDSYYGNERSKYSYEYEQPKKPKVDQNIINAMNLLGIKEGYTEQDVKKAYKKMAKIHHPDCGGLPENFKKLKKAYDYIMARI